MRKGLKNIVGLLAVVPLVILSCDNKPPYLNDNNTIIEGSNIYIWVRDQNMTINEPFNIAFRFDILLNEFEAAGKDLATGRLMMTPSGGGEPIDLKTRLFASEKYAKFELDNAATGRWKITYVNGYETNYDIAKTGVIYITTYGKRLKDLKEDEYWILQPQRLKLRGRQNSIGFNLNCDDNPYDLLYIHGGEVPGKWHIRGEALTWIKEPDDEDQNKYPTTTIDQNITSTDWDGTYDKAVNSTFTVENGSWCRMTSFYANGGRFHYTVKRAIKYRISCNTALKYDGEEIINEFADQEGLSYSPVNIVWSDTPGTQCESKCTLYYKGYSKEVITSL